MNASRVSRVQAVVKAISNAMALQDRFEKTGNVDDVTQIISLCESAISSAPPILGVLPRMFYIIGSSYLARFQCTGNFQDIDRAISHLQSAIESTPSGHADLPSWFNDLGRAYLCCFEHTRDLQDVDCAISHHKSALKSTPSGHTDFQSRFNHLGISYLNRFKCTEDLQDIDCAISHHWSAIKSTPSGHANLPSWFNNLGNSYLDRFKCTGDLQDIDNAISHHKSALEFTTSGHPYLPKRFNTLANSYACRFEHTRDLQDIDCAISYHQSAVKSTSPGHTDLPSQFNNLGTSYMCRFKHTGDLQDIDCAISHLQNAIKFTPFGHANLPSWFNNLGNLYLHRFEHTRDLQDIDHAISHRQSAIKSTPSGYTDHTDLPSWFNNLGSSYLRHFEGTGDVQDIDHAISYLQSAVKSTPSGHANLSSQFNNLGSSYLRHFECTGDFQDIEHAISYHQSAVKSTPSGHAKLPSWFNNLGSSYIRRFECTGDLQDIDCAISHHQSAVKSTPPGHTDLPSQFNNLGTSYMCRFKHTGDLQDIDCAISHLQNAIKFTPSGHADLPSWFNNIGNSYLYHFKCTGDLQDINLAISHHQSAVKSTPSGHADLPRRFNNLGNSYACRFEHTRDLQDIDCAIFHHQSAVDKLTPSGHVNIPSQLNNLGTSYLRRFERTGDLQDIDHAISYHQSAVKSTPSGHPDLPSRFNNLGSSYACRFKHTHYSPDIQNSIASYRQGAQVNGIPSIRLGSAKLAVKLSSIHDDSQGCLNDFALAISLLSEVAGLEQTIHRRHANLQGHTDLVGSAVATALRFNEPDLALEWLEQGRCLVWNQLNQLRTPIDDLCVKNRSLANRFINTASALESYGTRSVLSISSTHATLADDISLQDDARRHTIHAADYRRLLEEIRALPDFHDFLRPPKSTDLLSSLPSDGPVIIINIHKTRCDALALIAGIKKPMHIPLENFSLEQAEELQKTLRFDLLKQREVEDQDRIPQRVRPNASSMSFVVKELWCKLVRPILEALGYSVSVADCRLIFNDLLPSQLNSPPNPLDRGRLWWCPTGPLAFLPLHAAGIYDSASQPRSCISDFVISSYIPTVRSLKDKFLASSISSTCTSLVLISQPNTPGYNPIPWTRTETHALEALMKETAVDTLLLEDSNATREVVKAEMKSRSWVHFACHGLQDIKQPLESCLCLHDGHLELLEIIRQAIPNPDLAFLSACQTSKGDLKLSEEVVHLAAGMLAAGYRGVIGTMWSISDMHGPEFATEFYQYLLREHELGGLDSTRAAYALDYATKKVRETLGEDDTAFLTWVPYVHFGY
jgi:tetratricopeptide (TPR) repeat protein